MARPGAAHAGDGTLRRCVPRVAYTPSRRAPVAFSASDPCGAPYAFKLHVCGAVAIEHGVAQHEQAVVADYDLLYGMPQFVTVYRARFQIDYAEGAFGLGSLEGVVVGDEEPAVMEGDA